MKNTILIILVIAILSYVGYHYTQNNLGGFEASSNCGLTTTTAVSVGASNATTVLSATSGRAYARIQQVRNSDGIATSTLATSLGITLSTTSPYIEVGMNTDFPYVGAITVTASTGSTTVEVVQCR